MNLWQYYNFPHTYLIKFSYLFLLFILFFYFGACSLELLFCYFCVTSFKTQCAILGFGVLLENANESTVPNLEKREEIILNNILLGRANASLILSS